MEQIVHYYAKDGQPFQRITNLPQSEADRIAAGLTGKDLPVFKRFAWNEYLSERRKTESWLKSGFRKAGGRPRVDCPFYFTLGESEYFRSRYGDNSAFISIPLDSVAEEDVSFTFPDSMASRLWDRSYKYFNPEYHGIVFTKSGIERILDRFGLQPWHPDGRDESHDYFIEAQLWNEKYIKHYF